MTRPVFDPDNDPAQNRAVDINNALGEPDAIAAEAAAIGEPPIPRDAATLILYRLDDDAPRILMGCRSAGHVFMPNKYVFPGGRVDDEDADVPSLSELRDEEDAILRIGAERATRAFPMTAVRETFEETGLIVGKPGDVTSKVPEAWAPFYEQGALPCVRSFAFLGRAITPPMRIKRFDARFFMADAKACLIDDRPPVDGRELADLRWFTLKEASELDLPNITRFVISEIEQRLVKKAANRPFFLRWSAEGHVRERL